MSPQAMKRERRVYQLLDDHFDEEAGRYSDGWSDEKIAKDVGLAVTAVSQRREAAYGPIKVDPELTKAAADVAQISANFRAELKDVREILGRLEGDVTKKIEGIETRISCLIKGAA